MYIALVNVFRVGTQYEQGWNLADDTGVNKSWAMEDRQREDVSMCSLHR